MRFDAPFVLLDDARSTGAPARLYRDPVEIVTAHTIAEVLPALERVRAAGADGLHAAGFLSYEAGAAFEPAVATTATSPTPLVWFGLFTRYDTIASEAVSAMLPDPAGAWVGPAEPHITRARYDSMIAETLALIAAGDIYQANLTLRTSVRYAGDPLAVYAKLRATSGAGWGAIVATGTDTLLSLSPELFFARAGDRLTCRPMKGTTRRIADRAADAAAALALAASDKQRAENLMIVDLMRNDLARVAVAGSVAVPELFAVEKYPTVHQMVSTVTATLLPGKDAVDVIAAMFPCGSITGAPKVRAMQAITALEAGDPRGPYTGAIGQIDATGDAMFNVAIRTLLIRNDEGIATMGIGGGIVADSRAGSEWDECLAKAAFLTHNARAFDLIETMAFDPEQGVLRIERHLARMKASADTFGFTFDRHGARNELQAATFRLRQPAKVRLLLAKSGAIAIEIGTMPDPHTEPMRVAIVPLSVAPRDFRLRHKTSDRAFYDRARQAAGTDEVLFVDPDGFLTEGSFTSLFVERGDRLLTPPLHRGLLPGILREDLIASGRAIEADLTPADLTGSIFVGNALRGLIPAIVAVAKSDSGPL